jgi:hypothetical protein
MIERRQVTAQQTDKMVLETEPTTGAGTITVAANGRITIAVPAATGLAMVLARLLVASRFEFGPVGSHSARSAMPQPQLGDAPYG